MPGPNEAKTRKQLIDPSLEKAGWKVDDENLVGIEIPVDGTAVAKWRATEKKLRRQMKLGDDNTIPTGISDYVLKLLLKFVTRSTISGTNQDGLKQLEIITPSMNAQIRFVKIAQQLEHLRLQQHEAARQANHLFETLLHRAFRGEL